jgi:hypothetical protein
MRTCMGSLSPGTAFEKLIFNFYCVMHCAAFDCFAMGKGKEKEKKYSGENKRHRTFDIV